MRNTKSQLIRSAVALIRRKGYYGTGINEVIRGLHIPKGSLYHHFPGGKDELIIAALERTAVERAEMFKQAMRGKVSAEAGLKAVVDVFIAEIAQKNPLFGCPLATVTLDIAGNNQELQDVCVRLFDFWQDAITAYLHYKEITNSKNIAGSFLIRLEGALLLSKARQSDLPLRMIKKEIHQLLSS